MDVFSFTRCFPIIEPRRKVVSVLTLNFELATLQDLPRVVAIYNQSIPGRLATADLEPVSVASRQAWFAAFDPSRRPLWLMKENGNDVGWVGLEDFYGRQLTVTPPKSVSILTNTTTMNTLANRR